MTFYQVGAPESQTDQAPAVALMDWPDRIPDSRGFAAWKKASSNPIWYSSSTDNIHWAARLQIP
jgi:hypothetical protein